MHHWCDTPRTNHCIHSSKMLVNRDVQRKWYGGGRCRWVVNTVGVDIHWELAAQHQVPLLIMGRCPLNTANKHTYMTQGWDTIPTSYQSSSGIKHKSNDLLRTTAPIKSAGGSSPHLTHANSKRDETAALWKKHPSLSGVSPGFEKNTPASPRGGGY